MKVYVTDYPSHAGKWIYKGYQLAWKELGYEVIVVPATQTFDEVVKNYDEDYIYCVGHTSIIQEQQKDGGSEDLPTSP